MRTHHRPHKLLLSVALALLLAATGLAFAQQEHIIISYTPDASARPFEGWGTSLCWWANRLGYSDTLAQLAADALYGSEGLRLNIMRYNIGGGDNPQHNHITRTDSEVPGWLVLDESNRPVFTPDNDARQLNVLRRAYDLAGNDAVVEVFSNSPPYFMTKSGCSSGAVNAFQNNMNEPFYDDFARYLTDVTDYLQHDLGIRVASISPMNEPNTAYWRAFSNKQEGCHWDEGETQSRMIIALGSALAQSRSPEVLIAVSDETSPALQLAEYHAYSPEAKALIGRINTHTYMEDGRDALGELARKENLRLWMSEVDGDGYTGEFPGEMGAALWLGKKIIADINSLTPSAWVMWQAIDSHISTKGFRGNRDTGMVDVSGGFWGVAVADHDREKIICTQKYYGFGQFTRYIRPGSQIIPCGEHFLAAYHSQRQELTVVAVNDGLRPKKLALSFEGLKAPEGAVQAIRTCGSLAYGEHWADLPGIAVKDGRLQAELCGNSITTFVISGVTAVTP